MTAGHPVELEPLFGDYPLDQAYDEMRAHGGEVRPQYRALAETLAALPAEELRRRKQSVDLAFLRASPSPSTAAKKAPSAFSRTIYFLA